MSGNGTRTGKVDGEGGDSGTGLTTKLQAFEVTFLPGVPPAILHTEIDGEDPTDWQVFEVPVPDGYVAALVARR